MAESLLQPFFVAIKGNAHPFSAPALTRQLRVLKLGSCVQHSFSFYCIYFTEFLLLIRQTADAKEPIKVREKDLN